MAEQLNINIDQIKKEIFSHISNEKMFIVYHGGLEVTDDGRDLEKKCYWSELLDYQGFFKVAKFVGVKIIYYEEQFLEEDELASIQFKFFYNDMFHILFIPSPKALEETGEENEELDDKTILSVIPDNLCERCKKDRKKFDDKDFCVKCIEELKEEAEAKTDAFRGSLSKDPGFIKLPNENARILYVKNIYKEENKKNKFIYMKKLAKDAYAEYKMNK